MACNECALIIYNHALMKMSSAAASASRKANAHLLVWGLLRDGARHGN
jgi:hypothetical protein